MKRITIVLALLIGGLTYMIYGAESGSLKEELQEEGSPIKELPKDLKEYLLSFIAGSSNFVEAVKLAEGLSGVDREFNKRVFDALVNQFKQIVFQECAKETLKKLIYSGKLSALALKVIVKSGLDINTKLDDDHSALLIAAIGGNLNIVKKAVEEGANLNQKNSHGYTALMLSVLNNHPEVAKYLVEVGADKSIATPQGSTAYDIADEGYTSEFREMLKP